MLQVAFRTLRVSAVMVGALSLATGAAAQATQTKETVPGGPAKP